MYEFFKKMDFILKRELHLTTVQTDNSKKRGSSFKIQLMVGSFEILLYKINKNQT